MLALLPRYRTLVVMLMHPCRLVEASSSVIVPLHSMVMLDRDGGSAIDHLDEVMVDDYSIVSDRYTHPLHYHACHMMMSDDRCMDRWSMKQH